MNGWIWYEKTDTWHLVVEEREEFAGPEREPFVTYVTWCGLEFDATAPRMTRSQINQWADILHDECYRKAEETSGG